MHEIKMFERNTPYSKLEPGSGADWMPEFKEFIEDDKTIIASPHKIYSPIVNDLNLNLRKNKIEQIILAGMSANLCVESHMRYFVEQGFEVVVVKDATAAARISDGDGYLAALINFRFISSGVWTTDEAVRRMGGGT
jgi:nicotinamidase-related amidase